MNRHIYILGIVFILSIGYSQALSNTNLTGYWTLDQNGTMVDALGVTNSSSNACAQSTGKFNNSQYCNKQLIDFNNDNRYRRLAGENLTFSLWVNTSAISTGSSYVSRASSTANNQFNYEIGQYASQFYFSYYTGGADQVYNFSLPVANTCTHVAITYTFRTGSTLKTYLNGVLVTGTWKWGDGNLAIGDRNADKLCFGKHCTNAYLGDNFIGKIDEVTIWARILNATEILILSNTTYPFAVAVTPNIIVINASTINNSYNYNVTPTFYGNITSIYGIWNISLVINSTIVSTRTGINTTEIFNITSSTLTPGSEYNWYFNATDTANISNTYTTEVRSLYIINTATIGLSCLTIPGTCSITTANGCNYIQ